VEEGERKKNALPLILGNLGNQERHVQRREQTCLKTGNQVCRVSHLGRRRLHEPSWGMGRGNFHQTRRNKKRKKSGLNAAIGERGGIGNHGNTCWDSFPSTLRDGKKKKKKARLLRIPQRGHKTGGVSESGPFLKHSKERRLGREKLLTRSVGKPEGGRRGRSRGTEISSRGKIGRDEKRIEKKFLVF